MRFRKPELIPLLFIIGAFALLMGLGIWQVERLEWKKGVLARIEQAQNQPPLTTLPKSAEGLEYRNAALTGHYVMGKEFHSVAQKAGGYVWLVPFRTQDGQTLLVSTGWFAIGAKAEPLPAGTTTIKGILRPPRGKRMFSPPNMPEKNLWFTEDMDALSKAVGAPLVPLILDQAKPVLRNDHLEYAITWFLLALISLIMFALYHRIPEDKA